MTKWLQNWASRRQAAGKRPNFIEGFISFTLWLLGSGK